MNEPYPRPSRDEIAARHQAADEARREAATRASLPGAQPTPEPPDYMGNYSRHLTARMRALGLDHAALTERAEVTSQTMARAINGTGVQLDLAAKVAVIVGTDLLSMLQPYQCGTCQGTPYDGYICRECGAEGAMR